MEYVIVILSIITRVAERAAVMEKNQVKPGRCLSAFLVNTNVLVTTLTFVDLMLVVGQDWCVGSRARSGHSTGNFGPAGEAK